MRDLIAAAQREQRAAPRLPSAIRWAIRTAILTVSTSVSRREAEDLSGPRLAAAAEEAGVRGRGHGGRARTTSR